MTCKTSHMSRTCSAIAALALLCSTHAKAQVPITEKAIIQNGKIKLDIHYPQTGVAAIDKLFKDHAQSLATDSELKNTSEGNNSGSMSYEVRRNDVAMLSIELWTNHYFAGHAHGRPDAFTYNFLMPEGTLVGLADMVDGQRGLDLVSRLTKDDLLPKAGERAMQYVAVHDGQRFLWLADALELIFPPYIIAGYQTFRASIPLTKLASVIRSDPRVPVASFDCHNARTAIESAICSNGDLARLDRRVAQMYSYWRDGVTVPTKKPQETAHELRKRESAEGRRDKVVKWQREWLSKRNRDCASGSVACLTASYQKHLKSKP